MLVKSSKHIYFIYTYYTKQSHVLVYFHDLVITGVFFLSSKLLLLTYSCSN